MIQRHKILINLNFSAQTSIITSNLLLANGGYQVNNIQGLGGGIVNFSNVRAFLNNDINNFIINDFFSYLTGNTTTEEFIEIYNSDQKLSNVFNDYYESSVLNNQNPSIGVINNSLSGTSGTTIFENGIYNYNSGVAITKGLNDIPLSIKDATRNLRIFSALTTFTQEESYYIPIFIKRNNKQITSFKPENCNEVLSLILNVNRNNKILPTKETTTPIKDFIVVGNFKITIP